MSGWRSGSCCHLASHPGSRTRNVVPSRPEVGVSSREGVWTLEHSLLVSGELPSPGREQSWPPPGGPATSPHSPTQAPMHSGLDSGRQSEGTGRACRELGDSPSSLKETFTLWGTLLSPDRACARVSTYLAVYPDIFMLLETWGPMRWRGGGDTFFRSRFLPLGRVSLARAGLGCDTLGGGVATGKRAGPAPQQRPMYLRLFCMMTSVTASNTNWMLLVSVAQVKWE